MFVGLMPVCRMFLDELYLPKENESKLKKKILWKAQPSALCKKTTYMPKKYVINPYDKNSQISNKKQK